MNKKLEEALQAVDLSYGELVEIANDITDPIFSPINQLVNSLNTTVNNLPIDTLREYLITLQLKAFEISEIKEKSALKAELAEALQKEKYAISFNGTDGAVAVKDKAAQLATSEETLTEVLYNLVANLFKTKLDQLHRLVDTLKSILMSRMQEQKFMNLNSDSEIPVTTNGQVVLNNRRF